LIHPFNICCQGRIMETRIKRFAGAICLSFLLPGISWSAPEVIQEIYHDTSPPLSSIPAYSVSAAEAQKPMRNFPLKGIPAHTAAAQQPATATDSALQPPPSGSSMSTSPLRPARRSRVRLRLL
jgi:hypothetical protein